MAIIYQLDKRSGITYAYESTYTWDKEKKQSRCKRRLIGRVDPETKEIVPTDGRCKKRSPNMAEENSPKSAEEQIQELRSEIKELKQELTELKDLVNQILKK